MGAIDAKAWPCPYIQSIYWEYGSGCVLPRTECLMQNRAEARLFGSIPTRRTRSYPWPPATPYAEAHHSRLRRWRVLSYDRWAGRQPQFQAQVSAASPSAQNLADAVRCASVPLRQDVGRGELHGQDRGPISIRRSPAPSRRRAMRSSEQRGLFGRFRPRRCSDARGQGDCRHSMTTFGTAAPRHLSK